jgi:hypothetical protein
MPRPQLPEPEQSPGQFLKPACLPGPAVARDARPINATIAKVMIKAVFLLMSVLLCGLIFACCDLVKAMVVPSKRNIFQYIEI